MNSLNKIASISIPTAIGLGVAWLGARLIANERQLAERKMELEVQLEAKSLKTFQIK